MACDHILLSALVSCIMKISWFWVVNSYSVETS